MQSTRRDQESTPLPGVYVPKLYSLLILLLQFVLFAACLIVSFV